MFDLAFEMGLKPKEVRALTIKDFNHMLIGMMRRKEHDWDVARNTWSYIINYPYGVKNYVSPQALRKLPITDGGNKEKIKRITNHTEAEELLNEFI